LYSVKLQIRKSFSLLFGSLALREMTNEVNKGPNGLLGGLQDKVKTFGNKSEKQPHRLEKAFGDNEFVKTTPKSE